MPRLPTKGCLPPSRTAPPAPANAVSPPARLPACPPARLPACPPACLLAENKEYDLLTASNFQRWVISCYFSLTTMVTIGAPSAAFPLPACQPGSPPPSRPAGSAAVPCHHY